MILQAEIQNDDKIAINYKAKIIEYLEENTEAHPQNFTLLLIGTGHIR